MSVTNTQYATNTYKVSVANELTGSNNVIAGVNTAITVLGWTNYDTVNQTTYSPMVTKVYRVLNTDGTTYKYAILRWNTIKLQLNLSTCESWNNSTHVATNESWHSDGCFYHGYDLRQSYIIVNATARHLLLQSYILAEPGHWAGIFETERVAAEDIAANSAPCFFYTNSLMLGTPWGIEASASRLGNTSTVMMAFPRTPDNQVDYYASSTFAPTTSRGMWPPYYPSGNTGNIGSNSIFTVNGSDFNNLHLGSWWLNVGGGAVGQTNSASISTTGASWGWDGTKIPTSPISIDSIKKHMPFGRVYDMSITRPIGGQLDTTYFTANTAGGWVDNTGSNTEFLLMPFNGGNDNYYSNNYPAAAPDPSVLNSGIKVSWSNNSSVVYSTLASVGNNVWAAANNGIWIWNQGAGSNTGATVVYYNSNGILDIIFDGARSIYATTNTGLIQIDTETYATNTITSSNMTAQGGCAYLNMDNQFIYATNRTSAQQPYCHMIYRSNNTVAPNVITLAASVALNVASGWNTPMPDYAGFVYLSNAPGTTSSQQKRMLVANVDGANSVTTGTNNGVSNTTQLWYTTAAHTATFEVDNIWIEYNSNRIYHFQSLSSASSGFNVIEYSSDKTFTPTSNLVSSAIGNLFGDLGHPSQLDYYQKNSTLDYRGDLSIIQHRGYFQYQLKRPGIAFSTIAGVSNKFVLHHPSPDISNTLKVAGSPSVIWDSGNVAFSSGIGLASSDLRNPSMSFCTNGIRVFNNIFNGNTENRIQVSSNHFNVYTIGGYPTSRLLIKA
jgi:hypothetical protein